METHKRDRKAASVIVAQDGTGDYNCDGTADDVQIQAAIDSLSSTGGTVFIKKGTYDITASISLKSNISLVGEKNIKTIFKSNLSTDMLATEDVASAGSDYCTIKEIYFDCNDNNSSGIACYNARNLDIESVIVSDVAGDTSADGYGIYLEDCDDVRINNLRISNVAQRDGLQLKGVYRANITNVYIDGVTTIYGIDIHNSTGRGDCKAILLDNINIDDCARGIDLANSDDFQVSNVHITNCTTLAIDIRGDIENCSLTNIYIKTCAAGIDTFNINTCQSIIMNNVFIDTINGTSKDGMYLRHSTNIVLSNVIIDNCNRHGIYCLADATLMNNVVSSNNGTNGIYMEADNCKVVNSETLSNGAYGIREYTGHDKTIITNCRALSNTTGQILTVGANTITANNITS